MGFLSGPERGTPFTRYGFDSGADYKDTLGAAYRQFWRRAFSPQQRIVEANESRGGELPRTLNWFHVSCLGVGLILGAGIFVSTGEAAANIAGPAVIISFMIAGFSAILSTLCYSEFAVRFPLSGGAFNYLLFSLGEFVAFGAVATLMLEYVLANAAVARSFSPYFGQLIGKHSEYFTFPMKGGVTLDPMGCGLVLVCMFLVVVSTEHSNTTNLVITIVHVLVVALIAIVGFTKANRANLTPFVPPEHGIRGIFEGASFVFFSFIGFDCVSTMAEEVKKPSRDMPIGIVSCIVFVTLTYILMALSLVMMVPYNKIDATAAFAAAFETVGMSWMRVLVAIGALLGIVTGVLVGQMAVSRILAAVGRSHLLLPVLGRVHHRYHTPAIAVIVLGIPTAVLALVSDLPMLVNLVSAGTLFVFGLVALALIVKRYSMPASVPKLPRSTALLRTGLILALIWSAAMLPVMYTQFTAFWPPLIVVGVHAAITVALHVLVPQAPKPDYVSPLFPYVPSLSLLLNSWLCGSLPGTAWIQYLIFLAIISVVYFVYSIASSLALEERSPLAAGAGPGGPPGPKAGSVVGARTLSVISQTPSELHLVELTGADAEAARGGGADELRGAKAVQLT